MCARQQGTTLICAYVHYGTTVVWDPSTCAPETSLRPWEAEGPRDPRWGARPPEPLCAHARIARTASEHKARLAKNMISDQIDVVAANGRHLCMLTLNRLTIVAVTTTIIINCLTCHCDWISCCSSVVLRVPPQFAQCALTRKVGLEGLAPKGGDSWCAFGNQPAPHKNHRVENQTVVPSPPLPEKIIFQIFEGIWPPVRFHILIVVRRNEPTSK